MTVRLSRAAILPVAIGVALALPATATVGAATSCTKRVQRNSGTMRARLYVPTHHPRANHNWPVKVTAHTASGRAISGGRIFYQFVFSGQVVSCQPVLAPGKPYFTKGVMRDVVIWPRKAIGFELTFRVVAKTRYGVRNLNYKVVVQR